MAKPQVLIVGGGMITQVQILPSIYHLQRQDVVSDISICALDSGPLKVLAQDQMLKKAFPGQSFIASPSLDADPGEKLPNLFRELIAELPKQSIVVVAMPDQLHEMVIKAALAHDQHIMCVKPLVLKHDQSVAIEKEAREKGLVVGVEYHKRLDDRALMARELYRQGKFGEFKIGHAEMNEPYYYRYSNFQSWCTCENSDMFAYVGCHYVDQLHFITGLLPTSVSVYGVKDTYPNSREGYLWTDARVILENGGVLHVTNVMGYPDDAPGGNYQGIRLYCAGQDKGGMLFHDDQYRGVEHCYITPIGEPVAKFYHEPSPDYFKYVHLGGEGLTPVGYGYRSIELIIKNICRAAGQELSKRRELIQMYDREAVMATPKNSAYNELVMEAGRLSILNDGHPVDINYGQNAKVELRTY